MYICKVCGALLDKMADQCQACGADAIYPAERCRCCGSWHDADDMTGSLCRECLEALKEDNKELLDYILYQDDGYEDLADWYASRFEEGRYDGK